MALLYAPVADSPDVDGADQQQSSSADEAMAPSQQAAADTVYHDFLRSLTPEQLDFVRKDEQWPAIRTSANKTAKPSVAPHKKGDWSSQRSGFIKQVFLQMHAASEVDENTLLDNMFDCGKYSWLKDTARVTRAVQTRYSGNTRGKAFTALFHLCEVKCGAYLAESCFDEEYKAAKMVYIDMQQNPDKAPPADSTHTMAMAVLITVGIAGYLTSPGMGLAFAASCSAVARARLYKQQAHAALDVGDYDEARALMIAAGSLEADGFTTGSEDDEEAPPPPLPVWEEEKTDSVAAAMDDDEAPPPLVEDVMDAGATAMDVDETSVSNPACDENYPDGCPTKPYSGRDATPGERRNWGNAATAYYQFLLKKYQEVIERVRLDVLAFLSQENLDVSKFLNKKNAPARKFGVTKGLEQVQGYFCLATLYGEADGSYEPQRLDWYRAQYTTSLPDGWKMVKEMVNGKETVKLPTKNPLPKRCMFVLVTDEQVWMVLRDGNKNGQNVDQDLTTESPNFAEMLRLWMPHAASAQQTETNPFVVFKHEQVSYGKPYNESGAYGKIVKRAWVNDKGVPMLGDVNPQEDANKEWAQEDKHGLGCDWARKVTGRAHRGVVCKEGEKRDDAAAVTQGHSAATERASYRAV